MLLPLLVLIVLLLAWVGMWKSNSDKLTDYDLYGMDAEEYLKKQITMIYKAYDNKAEEWIYSNHVKTEETAKDDDWWFEPISKTFCITETHERFYEQNGKTETIKEYKEVKGVRIVEI